MKLLVLGGTLFLGRYVVEEALVAGYEVTTFTRGQSNSGIFPEAEHIVGDRDGKLAALRGRSWDGVSTRAASCRECCASRRSC